MAGHADLRPSGLGTIVPGGNQLRRHGDEWNLVRGIEDRKLESLSEGKSIVCQRWSLLSLADRQSTQPCARQLLHKRYLSTGIFREAETVRHEQIALVEPVPRIRHFA